MYCNGVITNVKYRYANGLHYEGSNTLESGICRLPFDLEGKLIYGEFNHDDKKPCVKGELFVDSEFHKGTIEIMTELENRQNLLVVYDNLRFETLAEFKEYLENKYGGGRGASNLESLRTVSTHDRTFNKFEFSLDKRRPKLNGFQIYEYPDGSFYYGTFKDDYIFCHKDELPKLYNINKKLQREIPYFFRGTLINNMKEGFGREYFSELSYYEGFFKQNKKEGKGKIIDLEKGTMYIGQFKNNQKQGQGLLVDLHRYKPYEYYSCLLYTSPSPRDLSTSRMPSSA